MPRSSITSTNQFNQYHTDSKKQYFFEQVINSIKNKNGANTPIQTSTLLSVSDLTKINLELDHLLKLSQDRIRDFEEQSNKIQNWINNKINDGSGSRDEKYSKYYSSSRTKIKEETKIKSEYKSNLNEPKSDASYYDIDSPGDFKKKKRDSDVESLTDSERGSYVYYKKSEDGSIQVAVTHNGKIRIKKGSNASPPPPSPSHFNSKLSSQIASQSNSTSAINANSLQNSSNITANTRNSNSRNGTPKPNVAKPLKNSVFKKEKKQKKSEVDDSKFSSNESQSVADAILSGDYSKVKPQNQIPIATFYSYCDQFLRPMTEDDINFLQNTEDITPYMVIPPLGKHYLESWPEEDDSSYKKKLANVHLTSESNEINSNESKIKQENDNEFTPLIDRIFGCLIEEDIVDIDSIVPGTPNKDEPFIQDFGKLWPKPDIPIIEDRIKQELFDLGILDDEKIDWKAQEDNEICTKIRELQQQLREQVSINEKRKKKLLKSSQDWIAYQQFNEVLEDQERQIESVYNKRLKLSKKKKRPLHKPIPENVLSLIQKRKSILKDMKTLFPPEKFSLPTLSKSFKDES